MHCDSKMLLIRSFNIFAHITDDEYEELGLEHNFIEAKKGDYIYFQSDYHNKLYFTKEGFIKIGYIDDGGNEVIKEIIQKGEVFGQITLEKNNLNGEFAKAYKGNVSLCAFTIEDFIKLLHQKPTMAIAFSMQVGNKLRKVENRLINLLNKDVKTRLINLMLQLAENNGTVIYNTASVARFLTHDDIARLIGSSRQTVTTFLNQFESMQLLKITKQKFFIPDVKKLLKTSPVS
ncbi:MAG: Crp/Fnr family transcriptional regulator [Chitinophagaceae bacterium]|nr:Crp/Fnr family transcriptional regulator [Chitinophagaceae bacterium]